MWYADQLRAHDIAAACKLSMGKLLMHAAAAGLPTRRDREEKATLALGDVCQAVERGAQLKDLHEQYGLSWGSCLNIMVLLHRQAPPKTRQPVQPLPLLHRCPNCAGLSRHDQSCVYCGSAW